MVVKLKDFFPMKWTASPSVPKAHIKPQKNLPKIIVVTMRKALGNRAGNRLAKLAVPSEIA